MRDSVIGNQHVTKAKATDKDVIYELLRKKSKRVRYMLSSQQIEKAAHNFEQIVLFCFSAFLKA